MSGSLPYIAGIGRTSWTWARSWLPASRTEEAKRQIAISAAVKALLDAGVSYDDVDSAISGGYISGRNDVFYLFGKTGVPMHGVEEGAGIFSSTSMIQQGSKHCVLVADVDHVGATAAVIVSEAFLWRHPYLKDVAVTIHGCTRQTPSKFASSTESAATEAMNLAQLESSDFQAVESNSSSVIEKTELTNHHFEKLTTSSLSTLCDSVWLLRGWKSSDVAVKHCLHCVLAANGTATVTVLGRADGQEAPTADNARHKNDGRDRLGYNPALQERDIAIEDWEATKARAEFSDEHAVDKVHFRRRGGDRAALSKL